MFSSPEEVFIFLFSIVATVLATYIWNGIGKENKKTDQLGKVNQR